MLTHDEQQELVAMWRGAKDHSEKQIGILANVFAVPKPTVEAILREAGEGPEQPKKKPGRKPGFSPKRGVLPESNAEPVMKPAAKAEPVKKDPKPGPAPEPDDPNPIPATKPEPEKDKKPFVEPCVAHIAREEFDALLENALDLTRKEADRREAKAAAMRVAWTVPEIKAVAFDVLTDAAARSLESEAEHGDTIMLTAAVALGDLIDRLGGGDD